MGLIILFCSAALIGLLLFPQRCSACAMRALRIWGLDVIPSLFPYMVFCRLLGNQLSQRRLPAVPVVALLGLSGGSPSGAAVIAAYSMRLRTRALFACCALTGAVSPMYLIATVGGWLGNNNHGLYLAASLLFGAVFAAIIASFLPLRPGETHSQPNTIQQQQPIQESIHSVLCVGGCIIIYSVLAEMMTIIPALSGSVRIICHVILEASGGMHALIGIPMPYHIRMVLLAAAAGFGGLSILSQNLSLLRPCGITAGHLLLFGLLRAIGAACAMALIRR